MGDARGDLRADQSSEIEHDHEDHQRQAGFGWPHAANRLQPNGQINIQANGRAPAKSIGDDRPAHNRIGDNAERQQWLIRCLLSPDKSDPQQG
jgi:hypothetical protein